MARKETTEGQVVNTEEAAPKAEPKSRGIFSKEQVTEIRALRAEKKDDGKPVHSHAALAAQFGTKPGVISHIVRNLSYNDPAYTPVNDMAGRKADLAPTEQDQVAQEEGAEELLPNADNSVETADGDAEAGEAATQDTRD